jgi:mRNA interferase RelE/StbE
VYEVYLERSAENDLRRLAPSIFLRIVPHIKILSENPRPSGCRKITGSSKDWRIRIGDHRIIYEIDDSLKAVRIMRIRHRREVYRRY